MNNTLASECVGCGLPCSDVDSEYGQIEVCTNPDCEEDK